MKQITLILISFFFLLASCKKEDLVEEPTLPNDVSAFTEAELAFVPYTSGERIFKKAPSFTAETTLTFKSKETPQEVFAWDQTYLGLGADPFMEVELRLRYLQTETTTAKTLALYMPYWDDNSELRNNLFETPIDTAGLSTGFFKDLVTFHSTILINEEEWSNVFEIKPLTSTPSDQDGSENFNKIYYSQLFGIIAMHLTDGTEWILFP